MTAYILQTAYGDLGPYLDRAAAAADAKTGDTITEIHGYVITCTVDDQETEHYGPFPTAAQMQDALAYHVNWHSEMSGPDVAVYTVTHH